MLKPILFLIPLFVLVSALSGFWSSAPAVRTPPGASRVLARTSSGDGGLDADFAARVRALPW